MNIRQMHPWSTDPVEIQQIQREMSAQVVLQNVPPQLAQIGEPGGIVRRIAGCDISLKGDTGYAVIVILSFPQLEPLYTASAQVPLTMPYIPGYLSFREVPVYLAAFERLPAEYEPDIVMLDGQGIAHPRRFGLACHAGLILDKPAIGCAKSRLTGMYSEPGPEPGDYTDLIDRGEVIGAVLRTKSNTKPVFVSPGHKIDIETARRYVAFCSRRYRIPEPTRLAHLAAGGTDILKGVKPRQQTLF